MKESFRPVSNTPPSGFIGKMKLFLRFILDFQLITVYRSLKKFLKPLKGTILDVGCGDSPYRHLINKKSRYLGADVKDMKKFDYVNKNILHMKGDKIPLKRNSVDAIFCTEVLEHVFKPEGLISEIKRVLKKGGSAMITVPWSARYHYVPNDYYRYTQTSLKLLFKGFSSLKVQRRGTDLTSICSKIIVACVRTLIPSGAVKAVFLPVSIVVLTPILIIAVLLGHLSLFFNLGSGEDPLGYTVYITK